MSEDQLYTEFQKSLHLHDMGRYEEAKKILRTIIGSGFNEFNAFLVLGSCEFYSENYEEADRIADICLEKDPGHSFGHSLKGMIFFQKSKYKKAEKFIAESIRLDPRDPSGFEMMAKIKWNLGDMKMAVKCVNQGLKLDPTNAELLKLKGATKAIEGNDLEAGIEDLKKALEQDPENPELLTVMGSYYLAANETKKAESLYRGALMKDPSYQGAKSGLIDLMKQKSRIFRLFYRFGFIRYHYPLTIKNIIILIICIKGMLVLGGLFAIFLMITWYGDVFYNSVLRKGGISKYLLSKEQIRQSNFFIIANIAMIGVGLTAYITNEQFYINLTSFMLGILLIGISFLEVSKTSARVTIGISALLYCLMCLPAISEFETFVFLFFNMLLITIYGLFFTLRLVGRE